MCCRVLQGVAVCCRVLQGVAGCCRVLQGIAVCYSVLQYVALCAALGNSDVEPLHAFVCNKLIVRLVIECDATCCNMLGGVAVCCNVLLFMLQSVTL